MYRTILVPLDGSPFGECALPLALSIARRAGATLQLVQVMPPLGSIYSETPLFVDSSFEQDVREHERATHLAYLDRTVKKLNEAASVRLQTVLLEGDIPHLLRQQATRSGAELVVMTTHARGPLGRFWLGSVADELVRKLPMPVLLVRPGERCTAFDAEPVLRNILIPLDGQRLAEQMIEPALALGSLMDADYTLLDVVRPMLPVTFPLEGGDMGQVAQQLIERTEALQAQVCQEAQGYLDRVAAGLRQRGYRVTARVEVEEKPALAILNQSQNADLVALSTHGRHGLSRLVAGSVADKVIRGSHLPVLAYHPADVARDVEWAASEMAVAAEE